VVGVIVFTQWILWSESGADHLFYPSLHKALNYTLWDDCDFFTLFSRYGCEYPCIKIPSRYTYHRTYQIMLRTFKEHNIRTVQPLDGFWNFARTSGLAPTAPPSSMPAAERTIHAPAAWENLPGLEEYRGQAWFWREIDMPRDGHLKLIFGGVSHTAHVFLDGTFIGKHYDSFTPFELDAPKTKKGKHLLAVHVDNSFGPHSTLHIENDYYTYGGITRPAEMHCISNLSIQRMHLLPKKVEGSWKVEAKLRLQNLGDSALSGQINFEVEELNIQDSVETNAIEPGTTAEFTLILDAPQSETWSPESPKLYTAVAKLKTQDGNEDDRMDHFGFRELCTQGTEILLNGCSIRLQGFNRHEDHPQFGNALPLEAMMIDLELARDMGANCIRTSHYPNDPRFLDLCDELGFLVWEESHARAVKMTPPNFREQIATSTFEMIDYHFNHPSIVIWGALNECASDTEEGRKEYELVFEQIKSLDTSRLTTFATCRHYKDICLDLVDVISFNGYPSWYVGNENNVLPELEKFLDFYEGENPGNFRDKPFIVSEFGAGAIYGNRQRSHSKWSEEYQANALDECLRVYLNHDRIAGTLIWQFCDCRVTFNYWHGRPRSYNNKGIVDEYRRPKLAYDAVQRRFKEQI